MAANPFCNSSDLKAGAVVPMVPIVPSEQRSVESTVFVLDLDFGLLGSFFIGGDVGGGCRDNSSSSPSVKT